MFSTLMEHKIASVENLRYVELLYRPKQTETDYYDYIFEIGKCEVW